MRKKEIKISDKGKKYETGRQIEADKWETQEVKGKTKKKRNILKINKKRKKKQILK